MKHDAIAVIDFGGQYAHLIATKVRRQHVLAEIRQPDDPLAAFEKYKGIVISGSPSLSALGQDSDYNKAVYDLEVPILGLCFGHQEIAKHYGGKVIHGKQEWGRADLHLTGRHPLFRGLGEIERVWMSHFDSVVELGPGFTELGFSMLGESGPQQRFAAIGSDKLRRYGFQYHPEVDDTVHGDQMLANFVLEICGCRASWTMEHYLEQEIAKVREQVGERSVFLLASGGVDSTVAASLFGKALKPEQLHLLHIDNGLMRKDESSRVIAALKDMGLGRNLHFVDASADFLGALQSLIEPEQKRAAIGATFIQVFDREARKLGLEGHLLGQGTIYPDTIETGGTKRSDTIKTHHNRVPIVEEMIAAGRVIEPLLDLYKVEVRELGEKLGVPAEMLSRHPFPGPGLGVRLLCSGGRPSAEAEVLDGIFAAAAPILGRFGLQGIPLPIKSVGVKADLRSYEIPILVNGKADWEALQEAAGLLFKNVGAVNRCLWNIGPEEVRSCRPVPATITKARLDLLREADHLVNKAMLRYAVYHKVWQCPVVLVPLEINSQGREFCVLRPISSARGMTAMAFSFPQEMLEELRESIMVLPTISGLACDLTSKPPGTIEWE